MDLRQITPLDKKQYNQIVTHIIQSFEWGEFKKSIGLPLLRYGLYEKNELKLAFQLTLHKIPFFNSYVGYLPKGPALTEKLFKALEEIEKQNTLVFVKLEPNIQVAASHASIYSKFQPSPKSMFTKYNFILDLKLSEEELLKNMHPKTRYNIRLAQKKGVYTEERTDDKAFRIFLKMHFETTKRQGFYSHNERYHLLLWETLKASNMARVLIGFYKNKPLSSWLLINFKDTIYYLYGASSLEHREVMANNLVAWESIRLGKKMGLNTFDMWGAANVSNPKPDNPYFGFHNFKKGYGGKLVEYIGTYDLVFNPLLYNTFTSIDRFTKFKVFLLKLIGK